MLDGEATYDPGEITTRDELINGAAVGEIGNPNLKWEEQTAKNIGFDASLFNNKINISADLFSKVTEDLLIDPQTSAFTLSLRLFGITTLDLLGILQV